MSCTELPKHGDSAESELINGLKGVSQSADSATPFFR
eukprot:CAMPEP_0183577240 /NCGR_PEP_ID=MMETSP0371-20130417/139390_1 /TAXON_ID=268820 /ORGANISM="Peridinium aciculiferum, Strain PAER-2" /LENGTH=36 /DNA_ID= /DNA_START= /DNA_END= /DNA_ORIENTATION=